jgi:hypothetical protein
MEPDLYTAVINKQSLEVAKILRENPGININWKTSYNCSFLWAACLYDQPEIVSLLLSLPDIEVNQCNPYKTTPFMMACNHSSFECAKVLLDDPRTNLLLASYEGHTCLMWAAVGCPEIVKNWIASGRELWAEKFELVKKVIDEASPENVWVSKLLGEFSEDEEGVRHRMRLETGWYDRRASAFFAQVVFLSDGLLQGLTPLTPDFSRSTSAARFFEIADKLPLELQMVLCYRMAGATRINIPMEAREWGFRWMVSETQLLF